MSCGRCAPPPRPRHRTPTLAGVRRPIWWCQITEMACRETRPDARSGVGSGSSLLAFPTTPQWATGVPWTGMPIGAVVPCPLAGAVAISQRSGVGVRGGDGLSCDRSQPVSGEATDPCRAPVHPLWTVPPPQTFSTPDTANLTRAGAFPGNPDPVFTPSRKDS
jgi:hypothetical protein